MFTCSWHIFEYSEETDDKIRGKLNLTWKAHKSSMKKLVFNLKRSREENIANRPKDVSESQWLSLVTKWEEAENQALDEEDMENISKRIVGSDKKAMFVVLETQ